MSNPTSNFGWQMPTATDLVTDLPADFEVFGQAVDTDFVDLLGGTTGQVLSKTSATDLDFTWVTAQVGDITGVTAGTGITGGGTSGNVTVTNSMATAIDAKGDLVAGTAADTFSRIAVGANNTVLTADSAEATGLKWATVAATKNYSLLGTGALTSGSTVTVSGLSNLDNVFVVISGAFMTTTNVQVNFRLNADASANYVEVGGYHFARATYSPGDINAYTALTSSSMYLGSTSNTSGASGGYSGVVSIAGGATAGKKTIQIAGGGQNNATNGNNTNKYGGGIWNNTATITSVSLIALGGTWSGGNYYVYGAA